MCKTVGNSKLKRIITCVNKTQYSDNRSLDNCWFYWSYTNDNNSYVSDYTIFYKVGKNFFFILLS